MEGLWQAPNQCPYLFSAFYDRFSRLSIILTRGILIRQIPTSSVWRRLWEFDNKPLNSLSTKFFKANGLSFDHTSRSGGNGLTNSSTHCECVRIDKTEWRIEEEGAP